MFYHDRSYLNTCDFFLQNVFVLCIIITSGKTNAGRLNCLCFTNIEIDVMPKYQRSLSLAHTVAFLLVLLWEETDVPRVNPLVRPQIISHVSTSANQNAGHSCERSER